MLLYYLPIENEYFDTKLLNIVSQYRQEKINRYKFLLDKKLSLFSSLLIDMCISQLTNVHYSKLIYGKSIYGKPFLSSISNLHFNYSHTHSCILCGISFSDNAIFLFAIAIAIKILLFAKNCLI